MMVREGAVDLGVERVMLARQAGQQSLEYLAAGAIAIPDLIMRALFVRGAKALIDLSPDMNTLVATGAGAAFAVSTAQRRKPGPGTGCAQAIAGPRPTI